MKKKKKNIHLLSLLSLLYHPSYASIIIVVLSQVVRHLFLITVTIRI